MTWETVPLGELTLPVARSGPDSIAPFFTYVDLSSVDASTKRVTAPTQVATAAAPDRARQVLRLEDVLVSTVRPNLNGVATVTAQLDRAIGSTGFAVLRSRPDRLHPRYLFHWVRTSTFVETMTRLATGASYPAVTDAIVRSSRLPLPPLPEQRRIAAILDEADALRRRGSRSVDKIDALLSSELNAAMKGAPRQHIGDSIARISSGRSVVGAEGGSESRVLKISAVTSGKFRSQESKPLPADYDPPLRHVVHAGDLLVSRANTAELVGASALVWDEPSQQLTLPDKLWRLELNHSVADPIAFQAVLASPPVRMEISRRATGSGGSMKNISQADFLRVPIALPSREAQRRFSHLARRMRSLRERLERRVDDLDALFASLQHRAFRGEL